MLYRSLIALIAFLAMVPAAMAAEWEEGTHYRTLSEPVETRSGDQLELAEVFWYGCPSCYSMQPVIEEWKETKPDDVNLRHVPASLRRDWAPHAKAFYAARQLGVVDGIHSELFDALAGERRDLNDVDAIAAFFEEQGVAEASEVRDAWGSFAVDTAMRRGRQFQQGAKVTGTPTLVVEGKYVISVRAAGSYENMLAIADHLLEKERSGD
ncbi:thiol:disulfide interchange protein DsbA/DsbL [Halospina sp. K52047b]|uniref:thiol:disulfide interchange protein DsbA/DsbL n=1 Tax=Halospina sp. K52047b TaxID=2614160 RepID=UPI001249C481|nr:thiol:disulfide interchange protein DsbA/DsbL [Halospina sp. K52047b]KAA8983482.1 thiol:disulfide interchange protein DsbA/DsbL [Halospina sp. K52047b]